MIFPPTLFVHHVLLPFPFAFAHDLIVCAPFTICPVQVLADDHSHVAAFPERECSVQRRNQKVGVYLRFQGGGSRLQYFVLLCCVLFPATFCSILSRSLLPCFLLMFREVVLHYAYWGAPYPSSFFVVVAALHDIFSMPQMQHQCLGVCMRPSRYRKKMRRSSKEK